ncbi:hypothetical protein M011DRAFT_159385 [Sporormia fimetaria CBS 119925]|uniref:A to I editase domain-containing protein n=1 Tax=Sporormia fimetaria CBS 119925 TaxID=1340428 RepID=A0A6A6V544_9PLEO|nr:hypothetical protein M011DRAFT_159385 [Sporormia fimetaria CBS 119925]
MGALVRHCDSEREDGNLACVSLGTGMKCLPTNKIPEANGNILHDWHAEVLALRAFNRFLLDEIIASLTPPYIPSEYLLPRPLDDQTPTDPQPFKLDPTLQIHMYCSEAPCGDASMELVMSAQEDATPWTSAPQTIPSPPEDATQDSILSSPAVELSASSSAPPTILRGRSHFSHLGAIRLKPSRPDAPPTLSKSCTDKITLTQCTSLLSSLASLLVSPKNAYLTSLVLPQSQYVETACTRAFSPAGRMSGVTSKLQSTWIGGHAFIPFTVQPTTREFAYSRRSVLPNEKAVPCNISAVSTSRFQESLIGGVLQGRKQMDPRGASKISRQGMWKAVLQVAGVVGVPVLKDVLEGKRYADVKGAAVLEGRRRVKEDVRGVLKGWVRNTGDEGWGLHEKTE